MGRGFRYPILCHPCIRTSGNAFRITSSAFSILQWLYILIALCNRSRVSVNRIFSLLMLHKILRDVPLITRDRIHICTYDTCLTMSLANISHTVHRCDASYITSHMTRVFSCGFRSTMSRLISIDAL